MTRRIDVEGRDVTDLPGLWDESDKIVSGDPPWRTCEWDWNESEEFWQAECGGVCVHFDCAPSEWGFRFCPYCGKPISEI